MEELDLAGVVQEAVENAAGLLGARPVPTASVPVVLHPHAAAMILGVLASSFSADAVIKRRSLLAGKVGEPVAAGIVTITDDARLPEGLASRPFDGEGVPAGRNELIAGGVLKGYLHNTYTRSEEHTSELQSQSNLVCRLLLAKKKDTDRVLRGSRVPRHEPQRRPPRVLAPLQEGL